MHKAHMGMVKTKHLARDIVFWPGMAKQIEDMISKSPICLPNHKKQAWEPIGSDLFKYANEPYLVMVDYYSEFIECDPLPDMSSKTVMDKMKANIARHGIMNQLITD